MKKGNFTIHSSSDEFESNLALRHRKGNIWRGLFKASTVFGVTALIVLLLNILNSAFGYVAIENEISPEDLAINGIPIEELHQLDLVWILDQNVSEGLFKRFESEMPWEQRPRDEIYSLVIERVVNPTILETWTLSETIFSRDQVLAEVAEKYPNASVEFKSWLSSDFLVSPQSPVPAEAGVSTAILGSLWTIAITILFAFPLGVGAAIYLEEYASDNAVNRLIQTNINNLAGVPSIIYGILGLAIFVRALNFITSGAIFGLVEDGATANGRTILSAGMTLGLLILPLIIINAQEAIKAVPNSLRQASFGIGCNPLADSLAPCAAQLHIGHSHRNDSRDLACNW